MNLRLLVITLFFLPISCISQIIENFDDGDFSDNDPLIWTTSTLSGTNDFVIINGEIQSNGPAATATLYLSTDLSIDFDNSDVEWIFKVRYSGGAPSSSNYIKVFLMSNAPDLFTDVEGYYLKMGESGSTDGIDLFKTASSDPIINDANDLVASGIDVNVRVRRFANGEWTLAVDTSGGTDFVSIGSVTDNDYQVGSFFGMEVRHSSTRNQSYYLDDVIITVAPIPDNTPPSIQEVTVISSTQLDVIFNENIDPFSGQQVENYTIDQGIDVLEVQQDVTDKSIIHVTVDSLVNGNYYSLKVIGVQDENGNVLEGETQSIFRYLLIEEAVEYDVVINEFIADPNPVIELPDAEFVELFNRSDKFIDLSNWTMDQQKMDSDTLEPNEYVVIVEDNDVDLFSSFPRILTVGRLSLNNSGVDTITIQNGNGAVIHSIGYNGSFPGIAMELINPNGPDYSMTNYGLSTDPTGGTPGRMNSIFDDTPDTAPPSIQSVEVLSDSAIMISFDEKLKKESAEILANYHIDGSIMVNSATFDQVSYRIVTLGISPLTSGVSRQLTINNVEDLSGNKVTDVAIEILYIEVEDAFFGEVVINEFLASPSQLGGIPNVEYLELYNVSNKYISLENWKIADAVGASTLPHLIFGPGEFLIITERDYGKLFDTYGNVLEVQNLISLNNGGDEISLLNGTDQLIAQISYSGSESGISMEMINPLGPNYSIANYGLSTHPDGGTPGALNSIFDDSPDIEPPFVETILVNSQTELEVYFNEFVTRESAEMISHYSVDGNSVLAVATPISNYLNQVTLQVSPLISGTVQQLTVHSIQDLSGNVLQEQFVPFEYIMTESAEFGDVVINELLPNPKENDSLPNVEYIELYNNSEKFIDVKDWSIRDLTSTATIEHSQVIRPNEYVILVERGNGLLFETEKVVEIEGFISLNNSGDDLSIWNDKEVLIASASYSNATQGVSLELINPNAPCITEFSYQPAKAPEGGTPGKLNSIFDDTPDTIPPSILSYSYNDWLVIHLSEVLDVTSLVAPNFEVNGIEILEIQADSIHPTSVELKLSEEITSGIVYSMTVRGIKDCAGNEMDESTLQFGEGRSPGFNEILITEILAKESPSIGLPEREYIEIYNATGEIISTTGVRLLDANSHVLLPSFNMDPDSYYVLTTSQGATEFGEGAFGLSGFPSLSNSGERLSLTLEDAQLIFSVSYDAAWHDEENRNGGVALEMKDIHNPCKEKNNWGSSIHPSGGTPGFENSLRETIPDNFGPEIASVVAVAPDTLLITFNEKIDPNSMENASFNLEPFIKTGQVVVNDPNSLFLLLNESLQESFPYSLTISGIYDCIGNEVVDKPVEFALPLTPSPGDIKLSEVLFNPRVNGVDFVEIMNSSNYFLSIKNWALARISNSGLDEVEPISNRELIMKPGEYLVFTSDSDQLFNHYPKGEFSQFIEMNGFPTYANDTGNVILINAFGGIEERFFYDESYHYDLLNDVEGVSLERISYTSDANDSNSWRSASSQEGFATPGYLNSQQFTSHSTKGRVSIHPKVFIPGNSGSGRDFTTINYELDGPGKFANVIIYDQKGRVINDLANGILLSNSGFLRWDGVTNNGTMANMGYYLVLFEIYDITGNTEILKETVVVGRDF